jgi:hypothetical protein
MNQQRFGFAEFISETKQLFQFAGVFSAATEKFRPPNDATGSGPEHDWPAHRCAAGHFAKVG